MIPKSDHSSQIIVTDPPDALPTPVGSVTWSLGRVKVENSNNDPLSIHLEAVKSQQG